MDLIEQLGRRIKALRMQKGMTQEELSEAAGIHPKYLSALETGKQNITVKTLEGLAAGLGVEPYELLLFPLQQPEKELRARIRRMLDHADPASLRVLFVVLKELVIKEG